MLDTYKHMALRGKQQQQQQQDHKSTPSNQQPHSISRADESSSSRESTSHNQQQIGEEEGSKASSSSEYGPYGRQCPPDTIELGRATWMFLHTMAAYYPEEPSRAQQTLMRSVMDGVAEFYPCSFCRAHLQDQVRVCLIFCQAL